MIAGYKIYGKVQGVFFRYSVKKVADSLELVGYAKNMSDGTVEVVASGHQENIMKLKEYLQHGPDYSKVDEVQEISVNRTMMKNDFLIQ